MQRLTKHELLSVKSLHSKKGRETEGLFLVEGPKMVKEALENRENCIEKLLLVLLWNSGLSPPTFRNSTYPPPKWHEFPL